MDTASSRSANVASKHEATNGNTAKLQDIELSTATTSQQEDYRAFMPTSDAPAVDNNRYTNNGKPLGVFFIFNHKKYKSEKRPRTGTKYDEEKLKDVAEKLGFEVRSFKDQTTEEIFKILNNYSTDNHKASYSCFACAFLTHGTSGPNGHQLAAYDELYDLEKVLECFTELKCSVLSGKPKFFFIQSCRGPYKDLFSTATKEPKEPLHLKDWPAMSLSAEGHFLIAQSSPPGHSSKHLPEEGTIFIQTLCKIFEEYLHKKEFSINEVLCKMNLSMTEIETENKAGTSVRKHIASITSQLTKDFFFKNDSDSKLSLTHANSRAFVSEVPIHVCPPDTDKLFLILSSQDYVQRNHFDIENLDNMAKALEFDVECLTYKTDGSDLFQLVENYLSETLCAKDGMFVCAWLTTTDVEDDGDEGNIAATLGNLLTKFIHKFKEAPKLVFIQEKTLSQEDNGKGLFDGTPNIQKYPQILPTFKDVLVVHSRSNCYLKAKKENDKNYFSSLFVSTLCENLEEHCDTLDIMQIMQRVNLIMSYEGVKEVPLVTTHLTKHIFFGSKPKDAEVFKPIVQGTTIRE